MTRSRTLCVTGPGLLLLTVVGILTWPRVDPLRDQHINAVVALSSGIGLDSMLAESGEDRMRAAINLTRELDIPWLVSTRVQATSAGPTSDWAQRRLVTESGLLSCWTIAPGVVHSTRDEAIQVRALLGTSSTIVVVTSPFHTRRACWTFEHVGFHVTCRASPQGRWWLIPYSFLYELAAVIKYRWKGWL